MPNLPPRRDAGPDPGDTPRNTELDEPTPTLAICGAMLCEVRYWTEAEWEALPERRRPRERVRAPGRGWFAAAPILCLN